MILVSVPTVLRISIIVHEALWVELDLGLSKLFFCCGRRRPLNLFCSVCVCVYPKPYLTVYCTVVCCRLLLLYPGSVGAGLVRYGKVPKTGCHGKHSMSGGAAIEAGSGDETITC